MNETVILLVEDETLILFEVEASLTEVGFEVVSASNAALALATFDATPSRFKALVTDIRLGAGLSGWDIGRHVRQIVPSMPIVYMSGDCSGDWRSEGVPESIMISKPFVMAQIITALTTLLNQQHFETASNDPKT